MHVRFQVLLVVAIWKIIKPNDAYLDTFSSINCDWIYKRGLPHTQNSMRLEDCILYFTA